MSAGAGGARALLVAAVVGRLRETLAGVAVFDAPPVRAGLPHAQVQEPVLADWSGVGWTGREGRLVVTLADGGERPVRLRALLGAVEDGLPATPAALGEGWRLVRLTPVRSRIVRTGENWSATAEFAVRMGKGDGA